MSTAQMLFNFTSRSPQWRGDITSNVLPKMHYFLRRWKEHRGDEYAHWGTSLWYFEVDDSGNVLRQIEAYESGKELKYDQYHPDDDFGGLAKEPIDLAAFEPFAISGEEFDDRWTFPTDFTVKHVHEDGRVSWRRPSQ